MSNIVKIAENENAILKIVQDSEAENPRNWDNLGTMVCWHSRYDLGDREDTYSDPRDFLESLAFQFVDTDGVDVEELSDIDLMDIIRDNCVILPLYLYDHSGITISTSPFSCQWDSGQVGWIYMTHEDIIREYGTLNIERAESNLNAEVKTYDRYLTGDIYGFQLFNKDEEGEEYDVIDSCWGFYGLDHIENELRGYLDGKYADLIENLRWA
jgi:hypothetical protein